jgi:guanosine-3',5'-bis(diphosphate) 3'-pyrophosphohydrolase
MIFDEQDLTLIFRALKLAADRHRDQRRKDQAETPYINHPLGVAETLWRVGQVRDVTILVAAILHDTLEDTDTTPAEIENLFGPDVLALVQEVSDDKSLPKETRKQLQIEHAPHKSGGAKQIKLADKIHNVYDVSHTPPIDWSPARLAEYLDWSEKVVAGLRGANADLERYYDEMLETARALLAKKQ